MTWTCALYDVSLFMYRNSFCAGI